MTVQPTPEQRRRARAIRRQLRTSHRRTLGDRARELLATGGTREEIARTIATRLDALIPLAELGPVGVVAEALDGVVLYLLAWIVVGEVMRASERTRPKRTP